MEIDTDNAFSEITYVSDLINEGEKGISLYTKKEAIKQYSKYKKQLVVLNNRIKDLKNYINSLNELVDRYSKTKKRPLDDEDFLINNMNNEGKFKGGDLIK